MAGFLKNGQDGIFAFQIYYNGVILCQDKNQDVSYLLWKYLEKEPCQMAERNRKSSIRCSTEGGNCPIAIHGDS